jgi:hypothetical protein
MPPAPCAARCPRKVEELIRSSSPAVRCPAFRLSGNEKAEEFIRSNFWSHVMARNGRTTIAQIWPLRSGLLLVSLPVVDCRLQPAAYRFRGARLKPVTEAAKSGQKWPRMMSGRRSSPSLLPARAQSRCKKIPGAKLYHRSRSDELSATIDHAPRCRGHQSAHERKAVKKR